MVTVVVALTVVVLTGNPNAVVPSGTVTLAGRLARLGLLLDNETVAPPAGAPLDSDTNPDVLLPPVTLDGLIVTLCKVAPVDPGGVTVSVPARLTPLYDAVIVTVVVVDTAAVETVNVPVNPLGATVVV